ncbi:MAG: 7-cyano-7-deazaguanine synthase QueC [Candidatus Eremiobacteraeota bacterium]|nr:7-cyano-7-deazaguanine synthase QueC [Candidatus Eremiobacteraeota bacterium]
MRKCLVLLSGGIDSSLMLTLVKEQRDDEVYAMSFDYGQRNKTELNAAIFQAIKFGVKDHLIITIDMSSIGGSSLTDRNMNVPKDRHDSGFNWSIPSTYVPARNSVFLSFALGWAEVLGVEEIYIGANSLDFAGYPDCRPEYFEAFEKMANLSTRRGMEKKFTIKIRTPLIRMSKEEIISEAINKGVDLSKTFSCYDPDYRSRACGHCDACKLRLEGFENAGIEDPIQYVDKERDILLAMDTTLLDEQ